MNESTTGAGYEILLTEKAATVIQEAFAAEQVDPAQSFVRIGALPGGCSGYKFTMDFTDHADDTDARFTSRGIQLIVDKTTLAEVLGSVEVDYRDGNIVEQGFAFHPLQESATCGCGQSFAPVKPAPRRT